MALLGPSASSSSSKSSPVIRRSLSLPLELAELGLAPVPLELAIVEHPR